jgi:hypothetical protein
LVAKQKVYTAAPESLKQLLADILEQLHIESSDQIAVFSYGNRVVLEKAPLGAEQVLTREESFVFRDAPGDAKTTWCARRCT